MVVINYKIELNVENLNNKKELYIRFNQFVILVYITKPVLGEVERGG